MPISLSSIASSPFNSDSCLTAWQICFVFLSTNQQIFDTLLEILTFTSLNPNSEPQSVPKSGHFKCATPMLTRSVLHSSGAQKCLRAHILNSSSARLNAILMHFTHHRQFNGFDFSQCHDDLTFAGGRKKN